MWWGSHSSTGGKLFEPPPLDPLACQNYLVILAAWNESEMIGKVVRDLRKMSLNVLVVDDGSTDNTSQVAEDAGAVVLRHSTNLGKGKALADGYRYAAEEGYDAIVTMDADGQHDPRDVPRFFDAYDRTGIPVLIGNRIRDRHHMPRIRRITNRIMSHMLNRKMTQYVADTQNGFRLYQTDVVMMVIPETKGFAAESEILLTLDEIDIRMESIPISAFYHGEKSHIRPIHDTHLFFKMLKRRVRKSA
jgi:glycosyltransferase involved in cell wall biosynthesis